jgi:hypothetical protein
MRSLCPIERVELLTGTVLFQNGEPVALETPCRAWEALLLREVKEKLGLSIIPVCWGGLPMRWRTDVETWWRIEPRAAVAQRVAA